MRKRERERERKRIKFLRQGLLQDREIFRLQNMYIFYICISFVSFLSLYPFIIRYTQFSFSSIVIAYVNMNQNLFCMPFFLMGGRTDE